MAQDVDKQCRFCLEGGGDLISPCLCSGTSKWVHRQCLDNWRTSQYRYQCFTHCNTCNFQYRVKYRNEHQCLSTKAKIRLYISRDLITILLALQIVIAALGAVVYAIDHATGSTILEKISGGDAAVGVYYLCGILTFLALLGLCTLLAACCCSSDACQCNDDDDTDAVCCATCYCCWWGYPCYPAWYWSPVYYPHGAVCCGAPGFGNCTGGGCCVAGNCDGDCQGGGDSKAMLIMLLIIVVILALIGLFVTIYILVIVGQRLFQRHAEILARQEACRQQEIVDLSKVDLADIKNYAVVSMEPTAPPEQEIYLGTPSAPPKDAMDGSERLWEVGGGSDQPLISGTGNR